jgi:DnaJ-class molecular chaperone
LNIKTIYGEVELKISPGTQDGEIKKILHFGVNRLPPNENERGHHFSKIKVVIPKKIDPVERKLFEELHKYETDKNNE